jgi:hypothetical protein
MSAPRLADYSTGPQRINTQFTPLPALSDLPHPPFNLMLSFMNRRQFLAPGATTAALPMFAAADALKNQLKITGLDTQRTGTKGACPVESMPNG